MGEGEVTEEQRKDNLKKMKVEKWTDTKRPLENSEKSKSNSQKFSKSNCGWPRCLRQSRPCEDRLKIASPAYRAGPPYMNRALSVGSLLFTTKLPV